MADEPYNLILVYLRRLDAKMDAMHADIRDLRAPVGLLEIGMANGRKDFAVLSEAYAPLSIRVDSIDDRLSRIERRLDIVHA